MQATNHSSVVFVQKGFLSWEISNVMREHIQMKNPLNAAFAQRHSGLRKKLSYTTEHTQVKNHSNAHSVLKLLLTHPRELFMRESTQVKNHSSAGFVTEAS